MDYNCTEQLLGQQPLSFSFCLHRTALFPELPFSPSSSSSSSSPGRWAPLCLILHHNTRTHSVERGFASLNTTYPYYDIFHTGAFRKRRWERQTNHVIGVQWGLLVISVKDNDEMPKLCNCVGLIYGMWARDWWLRRAVKTGKKKLAKNGGRVAPN